MILTMQLRLLRSRRHFAHLDRWNDDSANFSVNEIAKGNGRRTRVFNGSHQSFDWMTPKIET